MTSESSARLSPVMLEGPAGPLEALVQEREGIAHSIIAVVCHPHPLYGGTLHNKVAHRVAASLFALGAAVIRFNFRGVGASVGTFDRGIGELEDARAALAWMAARHPQARRWAAGFSFGSWVASRLAASDPGIEQLILIAPPVHTQTFEEMTTCATPKWVVQGTADDICRPENLERVIGTWAPPCTRIHIEGASHFFDKQLADLSRVLHEHLSPAVPAPPQPSA